MVFGQVTNERGGDRFGAGKKEAMKARDRGAQMAQGRETKNFDVSFDDLAMNPEAVQGALEDGRITLKSGLEENAYGLDVGALEERILQLIEKNVSLDYLNDADKQVARQILEDIAQGAEDEREQMLVAKGLEQIGENEVEIRVGTKNGAIEASAKPEFATEDFELVEAVKKDEVAAIDEAKKISDAIKSGAMPGSMMRRVNLDEVRVAVPSSVLGVNGQDVNYILSHQRDLGLPDLHYKTARELERAVTYHEKQEARIEELKKQTGFFGRLFGSAKGRELAEARLEHRLMQDVFDLIQKVALESSGIGRKNSAPDFGRVKTPVSPAQRARARREESQSQTAKVQKIR